LRDVAENKNAGEPSQINIAFIFWLLQPDDLLGFYYFDQNFSCKTNLSQI